MCLPLHLAPCRSLLKQHGDVPVCSFLGYVRQSPALPWPARRSHAQSPQYVAKSRLANLAPARAALSGSRAAADMKQVALLSAQGLLGIWASGVHSVQSCGCPWRPHLDCFVLRSLLSCRRLGKASCSDDFLVHLPALALLSFSSWMHH